MVAQKLYAGVKLRELRTARTLTQKDFAARLGVSLSYLNQMENNHRPISAAVVLGLAREFGYDVTELSVGEADRMAIDMREALADPVFDGDLVPQGDLQLMASNAPGLARAFLKLHRAHREKAERLASLSEAIGSEDAAMAPLPWEEVRDFFHYCDNYIDAVDRAAERQGAELNGDRLAALTQRLSDAHAVTLDFTNGPLRHFDAATRRLSLSQEADAATRDFQIAHQLALLDQNDLLEATLDLARFHLPEARAIAKIGLANYFAGALLMPYGAFLQAASELRHDLQALSQRFGTSLEQTAHRLSTLQRPGAKGVPFFFVRVDQAGTITKRHSATSLQFARFGAGCPLWNVHRAFETPGRFLRQLAEMPDGKRYFCLARDVSKPSMRFTDPVRRYAIGLGCEISHADKLVYADGMDLGSGFAPIGVSCRICERPDCHQRAVPPMTRGLTINPDHRGALPYELT